MDVDRACRTGAAVFLAALATRVAGVGVTTVTSLNPYAQADADRFAAAAARAAATLASGALPAIPTDPDRVVTLWGLALSPLWLLPGPNRVYGRLFTAVLGAVAAYAVFRIGRDLHSERAGVVATLPLVAYPSYVLVHSTVLREAFVLAGMVGATYAFLGVHWWLRSQTRRAAVALAALGLVTVVRWENLPLYAVALAIATAVHYGGRRPWTRAEAFAAGLAAIVAGWVARPLVRSGLDFLVVKRARRTRGRTVYFPGFLPDTLPKAVAFAPLGALYFLFTPFPWMVDTLADAVVLVEALGNLAAAGLALLGIGVLWERSASVTAGLGVGFVVGAALYGLVNANIGTNVRQRQMFLWVLFLFAGVAVAERLERGEWPMPALHKSR